MPRAPRVSRIPRRPRITPLACLAALGLPVAAAAQGRCPAPGAADRPRVESVLARLYPTVLLEGDTTTRTIDARLRALGVRGVSIAMIDGDRVAWAHTVGTRDTAGTPLTVRTRFQAASLSKPVAAIGALQLVAAGRIGLDDDVRSHLRGWTLPASPFLDSGTVTLRTLLSHRAGISVRGFEGYARDSLVPTLRQVLDGTPPANSGAIRVVAVPGRTNSYSGGGYTIVQQLVGDLAGTDFAGYMERRVLRPLGMARSTYRALPYDTRDDVARGHLADGRALPGGWHTYPEQAAASLWTTPCDYAQVVLALQRAARGTATPVITPATARAMLAPQGPASQGIGIGLKGEPVPFRVSHSGANEGFRTIAVGYLDRPQGVVIMTNGDRGGELLNELLRALALEYRWPDMQPVVRRAIALDSARLAPALGRYALPNGPTLDVTWRDGGLAVAPTGRAPQRLHAADDSTLFVTFDEALHVRLRRDGAGRVTAIGWGALDRLVEARRVESPRADAARP